jgi:hypothetical protein
MSDELDEVIEYAATGDCDEGIVKLAIEKLAHLRAQLPTWQPMGTAPKDGTRILACSEYEPTNDDVEVRIVFWNDWQNEGPEIREAGMDWCEQDTWDDERGMWLTLDRVLGWMPLPEPPK